MIRLLLAVFIHHTASDGLVPCIRTRPGQLIVYEPVGSFDLESAIRRRDMRPCDWNYDGYIDSIDLFEFLDDYFGGWADFNHDGARDTRDFFDFLGAFSP